MATSSIEDRRQALVDERAMLESIRSNISAKLPNPPDAQHYITTKLGDGSQFHGEQIRVWIDQRLDQVQVELGRLPARLITPVAIRMNVLGKDFSQYQVP